MDLRLTGTNSGDDSDGSIWGIAGGLIWVVALAAMVSLVLLLILIVGTKKSVALAVGVAALPLAAAIAYVVFKQSHPPGYDVDTLDYWINGPGFGPSIRLRDEADPLMPPRTDNAAG